jgi:hypothetical protein
VVGAAAATGVHTPRHGGGALAHIGLAQVRFGPRLEHPRRERPHTLDHIHLRAQCVDRQQCGRRLVHLIDERSTPFVHNAPQA